MELKHLPGIYIVGVKKIWLCIVGMQKHNTQRFGPKQSILAEEVEPPQAEMSPNWITNKIKCNAKYKGNLWTCTLIKANKD